MPYYFYVLQLERDGFLYKGVAKNIGVRLAEHSSGKTKSLRHRIPFKLVYHEEFCSREEALAREKWSKTLEGGRTIHKILASKP
ncbi:MAG TPA: GIY-YIG nuclease family protein [candidate division Zixibacteria bacterium]|nr:GIY-YIG nuclease family protein [candidate division Zixibacteria bacterium]